MNHHLNEDEIRDRIRKRFNETRQRLTVSDAKKKEFIANITRAREEKKNIVFFNPFEMMPAYARVLAGVIVLVGMLHYFFAPRYPYVSGIKGTVKIYSSLKNEWVFVQKPKVKLHKDDIVKTFGDGQADISFPKSYHMRLKRDTEIQLARVTSRSIKGDIKYRLNKGKVFAYYKKSRMVKDTFNILTKDADVSVIGTDFMVNAMPQNQATWVGVLSGIVKVSGLEKTGALTREKLSVYVKPGNKTVVRHGAKPLKPVRLMENELLEMEELYRIGVKPQVALLISTGPARTRELLQAAPLYISAEKGGVLPAKIYSIAEEFRSALNTDDKEIMLSNIRQFEDIVDEYPNPKYDVQFLLLIGARYKYIGKYRKAIETFERIIRDHPSSKLVSVAHCAIAVIYEEYLKDNDKAEKIYRKIVSDYPSSPEYEEAVSGLKRISKI